jgi:hypothetical protein
MDARDSKRVRIVTENGRTCYCVGAWPGWKSLNTLFIIVAILTFVEAVMLVMQYIFTRAFASALAGHDWFTRIMQFVVGGVWPVTIELTLAAGILYAPFLVIGLLCSKRVWLDDTHLHLERTFLGWTWHKRMPIELLIDISLGKVGSQGDYDYCLTATYWLNLPHWIENLLPKKADRWFMTLLDGIPTKEEADFVRDELLKVLTKPDSGNGSSGSPNHTA